MITQLCGRALRLPASNPRAVSWLPTVTGAGCRGRDENPSPSGLRVLALAILPLSCQGSDCLCFV